MPTVFSATVTDSLDDMAQQLGLPKDQFLATVKEFNESCQTVSFILPSSMDCERVARLPKKPTGQDQSIPHLFLDMS